MTAEQISGFISMTDDTTRYWRGGKEKYARGGSSARRGRHAGLYPASLRTGSRRERQGAGMNRGGPERVNGASAGGVRDEPRCHPERGGWFGWAAKDLLAMLDGPKEILRLPTRPPPTLRMTPGFIRSATKESTAPKALKSISPGRKPWVRIQSRKAPKGRKTVSFAPSALKSGSTGNPRLTPWANTLLRLRRKSLVYAQRDGPFIPYCCGAHTSP